MSDDPIIHIAISSVPAFYFGYILLQGIWGTAVMSAQCKAKNLRTCIRGSLVLGSAGLTSMAAYAMCNFHCKKSGESKYLPLWLMTVILVSSIISLVFQFGILSAFSSSDPEDLPCKKDSNFKLFVTVGIVLSFIALFSSLVVIVRAMKRKNLEAKKRKQGLVSESEKQELESAKKRKEEDRKQKEAKEKTDRLRREIADSSKPKSQEEIDLENLEAEATRLKAEKEAKIKADKEEVQRKREAVREREEAKRLRDEEKKLNEQLRRLEQDEKEGYAPPNGNAGNRPANVDERPIRPAGPVMAAPAAFSNRRKGRRIR